MWNNQGLLIPRQLIQCSENLSVKFWRRLRMNHFSSSQIKWLETPQSAIKPLLPLSSRTGTYYRGLQKSIGSPGSACRGRQTKIILHHSSGKGNQTNSNSRKSATYGPPLGTINVIFVAPGRTGSCPSKVMSMA